MDSEINFSNKKIISDRVKESKKRWRDKNPDRVKESRKKWREKNPDHVKESRKKWREKIQIV